MFFEVHFKKRLLPWKIHGYAPARSRSFLEFPSRIKLLRVRSHERRNDKIKKKCQKTKQSHKAVYLVWTRPQWPHDVTRSKLRFLRFFTCVFWGISPAQIFVIVLTTAIRHSVFYFSSFSMFIQSRISKSVVICSFCSFLFFSPLYLFHPTLFYSSFYSLFCFLPLFIRFIFWSPLLFSFQICYPFFSLFLLLCSVCFSLMLYSYSICSLSISLHPFRSLYLILLCYLFYSCFCFLYISSFW